MADPPCGSWCGLRKADNLVDAERGVRAAVRKMWWS